MLFLAKPACMYYIVRKSVTVLTLHLGTRGVVKKKVARPNKKSGHPKKKSGAMHKLPSGHKLPSAQTKKGVIPPKKCRRPKNKRPETKKWSWGALARRWRRVVWEAR